MRSFFESVLNSVGGTWASVISFLTVGYLLSKIDVAKIPINPWGFLRKCVRDFFGREYAEQLAALEAKNATLEDMLSKYIKSAETREANNDRRRILKFEGEIQRRMKHTEEEFADALETIKHYETYCTGHPDYKNHIATESAEHIKRIYRARLENKKKGTES